MGAGFSLRMLTDEQAVGKVCAIEMQELPTHIVRALGTTRYLYVCQRHIPEALDTVLGSREEADRRV